MDSNEDNVPYTLPISPPTPPHPKPTDLKGATHRLKAYALKKYRRKLRSRNLDDEHGSEADVSQTHDDKMVMGDKLEEDEAAEMNAFKDSAKMNRGFKKVVILQSSSALMVF